MNTIKEDIKINSTEVKIHNLSKRFDDFYAVKGVSLHIEKGDFFTFLGPSGCGKTTLLRMVAGFTMPNEGDIYFDDQRMNNIPPWERNVGMVFQSYALWPHMTVYKNIAFGLKERKIPKSEIRERVKNALEMVNLQGMENRRPSQLSGGQQQRVALARTLVIQPRLLLLDEPLSNLDAKLRIQMRNELLRLQREMGITSIYVTHDQEEALAISTHIAVMSKGEVIQQGTPREIYESPNNQVVADFVGTSNFLECNVKAVSGDYVYLNCPDVENSRILWKTSLQQPPAEGSQLTLNIRPESMRISNKGDRYDENILRGKIITSVYLGSLIQYQVETSSEKNIRVNVPNPRRIEVLEADQDIILTFSPDEAILLHA
ncbi:polyamine ABC transporter ATP-binding protein [Candidatus Poribacteria bacterium]|nr:polyamine ABC transporter ATP-binding protein [Candidatus Poribacteria bacterium]